MSERIEWSETETREYRCWLRVVRCWEVSTGRIEGQTEGAATVDDLRRACDAAGLTLATAQHEEDLAKLGREMNEVVTQRDAAREDAARGRSESIARIDEARLELRSFAGESLLQAAKRMVRAFEAENANFKGACAAVEECRRFMNEASAVLGVGPTYDPNSALVDAARRVVAERDEAISRAEKAEAALESARASASLVTMVGDIGVRNSGDATRLEALLAERDALAAELAAIRAATGEEPNDHALFVMPRRFVYNLGRTAAQGEVARMSDEVATLRARVAELEAAPQGQPVATDEELWKVFANAELEATANGALWPAADLAGALAVARHVRAERPACLVARAVALGCEVRIESTPGGKWDVTLLSAEALATVDGAPDWNVPAADVPATLARLLDEVEASRKAVQK
jgi:hypothetical protein